MAIKNKNRVRFFMQSETQQYNIAAGRGNGGGWWGVGVERGRHVLMRWFHCQVATAELKYAAAENQEASRGGGRY